MVHPGMRRCDSWKGDEVRLEERVRAAAARYRDRRALRVGSTSLTYRELIGTADAWAGRLRRAAPHEDNPHRVGVLTDRTLEGYVGILAALTAGATVVPMSPDWPAERVATIVDECALSSIVVDGAGLRALATGAHAAPHVSMPPVLAPNAAGEVAGELRLIDETSVAALPGTAEGREDVAYILFTSGSTGRPKAVPITHSNVDAFLRTMFARYDFDAHDVFSQTFDLTFDLAFFDMFVPWAIGAALVHVPAGAFRRLHRFVNDHGLTVWFSVPSAISFSERAGTLPTASMPSLRWSLFCGEPLLSADAATWQAAAPGTAVENLYGPTELTIACSAHRWSAADDGRAGHGIVPIGTIFPGLEHVLVDQHGEPIGQHDDGGELCVTGAQMFGGYLRADDNKGRFVYHDGRAWYRTGDLVRMHGDVLLFDGRVDHQVQIHGYRIELAEIEHWLRQLAGIKQAVAVAVGVGIDRHLIAFYTGIRQEPADIARRLDETLPRYMVPMEYIWLDELPLNARGKTDRSALALRAEKIPGVDAAP
jgi:amino acid adenylation domain-containing protein